MTRRFHRTGFTLMEMIVSIAIIMILASILLPAVNKTRQYAWRSKARHSVVQVVTAWTTYLQDNRAFPDVEISQMDVATMNRLNAKTVYMDLTNKERQSGMKDRWGSLFQVAVDNGVGTRDDKAYDGEVTPYPGVTVRRSVVAWSMGPDKQDHTDDDIRSWK